jgi:transglutaminase-like putative cysteine protease
MGAGVANAANNRFFDEMTPAAGGVRAPYGAFARLLEATPLARLKTKQHEADAFFRKQGITFLTYGEDGSDERLIPFDPIPRILDAAEWDTLRRGCAQRVRALNRFLADIYHDHEIVQAGIVPADMVHTTAAEALADGAGVCQDHAHVFISACRILGVPARYVGGYLATADKPEEHAAGHAWACAQVPDLGWVSFDPANAVSASERYVRATLGLDYGDVSPVRGVRQGGGEETLSVAIRLDAAVQQ